MANRNVLDLNDYSCDDWDKLIRLANNIRLNPNDYLEKCRGRVMATLFYEPSTRTQMSFQAAMLRLGGQIIGFDNPVNSSVSKGETLRDTVRIVSGYSDIIVIRHPKDGAAAAAAEYSSCPIINAGDGGHLHPTQTLTDLLTLTNEKGRLTGLNIGLCGDLKFGRTVHSLIKTLCAIGGNRFFLISTPQLGLPEYVKEIMDSSGSEYHEVKTLDACIGDLDVLYMTRIQQERFASREDYERQRGVYVLDMKKLSRAKPDLAVLHPLPRVDEIADEVDGDSRALYFKQAGYGMFARMSLILMIIEGKLNTQGIAGRQVGSPSCNNPRCITRTEKYLPHYFITGDDGSAHCAYCDLELR